MTHTTLVLLAVVSTPSPGSTGLAGVPIAGSHVRVGEPARVDNLAVFPIYGEDTDLGDMISLEAALEAGLAEVRERRGTSQPTPHNQTRASVSHRQEQRSQVSGGATVNTLVIENKSNKSVVVLAGTVVRGGNQDRQIGQDFVIGPKQTAPVDAFCVERGRWSNTRSGKSTAGRFEATAMLAPQQVRAAAQYEGNQGKVWDKVAAVNRDNKKEVASGTLMATYDDDVIIAKRNKMTKRIDALLAKLPSEHTVVGLAYAVDGKLRGARWFFAHSLFEQHRRKLVGTAAVEAITAAARREGPAPANTVSAADVVRQLTELRKAKVEARKKTKSMNANVYKRSEGGYSSEAVIELDGREVPVTVDVLMH